MEQNSLAKWLKMMIIGTGICGVILYSIIVFDVGRGIVAEYPEFAGWFWPWAIFIFLMAIPCYVILWKGWKITVNIGEDRSFITENADMLSQVSKLAVADAGFILVGNVIFLLLNGNHPAILILFLFVSFIIVVVAAGMAMLSHLIRNASKLQEETDLTI